MEFRIYPELNSEVNLKTLYVATRSKIVSGAYPRRVGKPDQIFQGAMEVGEQTSIFEWAGAENSSQICLKVSHPKTF